MHALKTVSVINFDPELETKESMDREFRESQSVCDCKFVCVWVCACVCVCVCERACVCVCVCVWGGGGGVRACVCVLTALCYFILFTVDFKKPITEEGS